MKILKTAREILLDLRDFGGELVDAFRDAINREPEMTPDQRFSFFESAVNERVAAAGRPFPGYEQQHEDNSRFNHAVSVLLGDVCDEAYVTRVCELLDRTFQSNPGTAIHAADRISFSSMTTASYYIGREMHQQNTEDSDAVTAQLCASSPRVAGLNRMMISAGEKEREFTYAVAASNPEKILDWTTGHLRLALINPDADEKEEWAMRVLYVHKSYMNLVTGGSLMGALRTVDLDPYYDARPADVLLASALRSNLGTEEECAAAAEFDAGVRQRIAAHPESAKLLHLAGVIDKMMPGLRPARQDPDAGNAPPSPPAPAP